MSRPNRLRRQLVRAALVSPALVALPAVAQAFSMARKGRRKMR